HSLSVKWLYTVSLETPARVAMASMLVPSKPCSRNRSFAASRMAARFSRSLGRPGPQALAGIGFIEEITGLISFASLLYHAVHQLSPQAGFYRCCRYLSVWGSQALCRSEE